MASNHSMYKKPSKQLRATPFDKANSSWQLKFNKVNNLLIRQRLKTKLRLHQVRLLSKACNNLIDEGKIPKEYFSPYMPKVSEVYEIINSQENEKANLKRSLVSQETDFNALKSISNKRDGNSLDTNLQNQKEPKEESA